MNKKPRFTNIFIKIQSRNIYSVLSPEQYFKPKATRSSITASNQIQLQHLHLVKISRTKLHNLSTLNTSRYIQRSSFPITPTERNNRPSCPTPVLQRSWTILESPLDKEKAKTGGSPRQQECPMLVQLLDDCVNLIVHGTVPEDVFSARLYVNRVMSSLTHAFTMDDKRRSEWRSQRELETRAKISQTFHVCKRRLSILLATQQVS